MTNASGVLENQVRKWRQKMTEEELEQMHIDAAVDDDPNVQDLRKVKSRIVLKYEIPLLDSQQLNAIETEVNRLQDEIIELKRLERSKQTDKRA